MRQFPGFERGINLGGWLSQYREFSYDHFDTFIVEKDIERIASWGLDHVRVPVDYQVIEEEDGTFKERGFQYIATCIEWCRKYGLHMIIDIHQTFGYNFDPMCDTDKTIFFYDEKIQARFYRMWKEIASRFGKDSDMVCFELLNEIVNYEVHAEWDKIAHQCVKEIRTVAPDSWIIYGGVCYNSVTTVPLLSAPEDDKVVFTFHCYEPIIFTHQGAYWIKSMPSDFRTAYPGSLEEYREISDRIDRNLAAAIFNEDIKEVGPQMFEVLFEKALSHCEKMNVPVYCGEYGVIDLATPEDTFRWLKDINDIFKKYNVARGYWSYKEMDFGIEGERCKDMLDDILSML